VTWLPEQARGATPFARVFDLCPELHADWAAFADLFSTQRPVDPALLDLCRVRIAQILGGDGGDVGAGVAALGTESIAALEDWQLWSHGALDQATKEVARLRNARVTWVPVLQQRALRRRPAGRVDRGVGGAN